jgi:hypothetical protein
VADGNWASPILKKALFADLGSLTSSGSMSAEEGG